MKKTIKDLDQDDRPREKLIKYGADLLTDEELLAIIIATGNKEKKRHRIIKRNIRYFLLRRSCRYWSGWANTY